MYSERWNQIAEIVKKNNCFILSTHINPDGDGLGSEIAMYHVLKKMGKQPLILNLFSIPAEYQFMFEGIQTLHEEKLNGAVLEATDVFMVFDVSSSSRMKKVDMLIKSNNILTVCIDHHPIRTQFTDYQVIDIHAPSTANLVYEFINYLNPAFIDLPTAEALYVGVMTDTGSFRFENSSSEAFKMAAHLVEIGVRPDLMYRQIYESRRPEQVKLLGSILQEVHYECEGRLGWFSVRSDQIKLVNALISDVDGFTDFVRSIKGVEVALMFLEVGHRKIRINFRSKGKVIINAIAQAFNGGGHKFAAGALLECTLEEAVKQVVPIVRDTINTVLSRSCL